MKQAIEAHGDFKTAADKKKWTEDTVIAIPLLRFILGGVSHTAFWNWVKKADVQSFDVPKKKGKHLTIAQVRAVLQHRLGLGQLGRHEQKEELGGSINELKAQKLQLEIAKLNGGVVEIQDAEFKLSGILGEMRTQCQHSFRRVGEEFGLSKKDSAALAARLLKIHNDTIANLTDDRD